VAHPDFGKNGIGIEATVLLKNGKIKTFDKKNPFVESVAIHNDRIVAIGKDKSLKFLAGKGTQEIDLGRRTVLPGFIDAHEHLSGFSEMRLQTDLSPSRINNSLDGLIHQIQIEVKKQPKGKWIRGVLFDDTKLCDGQVVTKNTLDQAASENPVIIMHVSGNVGIVNSRALAIGNLNDQSIDPKGGKFGRDKKTGELNGYLYSNALFQFINEQADQSGPVVPPFERDVRRNALLESAAELNAAGITSVTDAWVSPNYLMSYQDVCRDHSLPVRVNMLVFYHWLPELEKLKLIGNWGNEWLRCTGLKLVVDGAIAGRTAALQNGYQNDPDDRGILVFQDPEKLNQVVERIHRLGYQACIHANGDAAIDMALDAIDNAQAGFPRQDARHRIEHCTIINQSILSRMRRLNVLAIPFGSYLWQHGEKILPFYGPKRAEMMFGHKSFLDAGVKTAGASDHPAGLLPPLLGIQTMVTRKTSFGEVIGANQKISIEEALKMYTVHAAFATFEENIKGSITPGKMADMVVLKQDPWKVSPEEISEIDIHMTIMGGRVVYERS